MAVDLSFYRSDLRKSATKAEPRARPDAPSGDVLDILEVRGIDVPEAVRERVTACDDPETGVPSRRRPPKASSTTRSRG
ncbi:hypothetical protein ACIO8H_14900 [Streptomyces sp. NPDC087226]|uniref:hypothetical protein n=1 Tax=Streptomyces sp. NPDC087226 TaxID=3365771 RepID=UPI0037FFDF49